MTNKSTSRLYGLASLRYRLERQIRAASGFGNTIIDDAEVFQKLGLLHSAARFAERFAASTDENELQEQIDLLAILQEEARIALDEYHRYIACEPLWRRLLTWLCGRTSDIGPP